jgi:hypothetical protein
MAGERDAPSEAATKLRRLIILSSRGEWPLQA